MTRVGASLQTLEAVQPKFLNEEGMSYDTVRQYGNAKDIDSLRHAQYPESRFHGIDGIPPQASEKARIIDASLASKADWTRHQANLNKHPVDIVEKFGKAANNMIKTYRSYTPDEKLTVGTVLAGGIAGAAALTGISYFIGQVLKSLVR